MNLGATAIDAYGRVAWSGDVVIAACVGVGLAGPVLWARAATPSGAAAGAACAAWFTWAGGAPGLIAFAALVVGGTAASRAGRERKAAFGAAQEGGGRRSARHVFANAGAAVLWFAFGRWFAADAGDRVACELAACASLIGSFSDTAAGEIGMLFRERPRMLLVGPYVERGRDGGMTLVGTAIGAAAAAVGAGLVVAARSFSAAPDRCGPIVDAAWIAVGAFAGCVVDSLLGAGLERKARLGNEGTNFASSLLGGGATFLLAGSCA